jgi:hypothetical protein
MLSISAPETVAIVIAHPAVSTLQCPAPRPSILVVWGPGSLCSLHTHHSAWFILGLTGQVSIRRRHRVRWRHRGPAVVAPGIAHEVDARGSLVLSGFIDPGSEFALAPVERQTSAINLVPESVVARWRQALGNPSMLEPGTVEAWLSRGYSRARKLGKGTLACCE